ncbi:dynactin [Blastomyces dermatitidis ATCC 18188]|uniref:Dynactin n=1 Tax=Ajellomyces dermatitidis (strain ATCC 18188 / CBS 674.68) TaxID=653446 RepID=F2TLB7_AJEDA|nr:dynactin [Blastomyces dermatitidis ATCC 18188]
MGDLSPGQLVCLSDGRHAVIRFIGSTSFAPGDWIGVELNGPTGKNDGSVQGERYFDCEHGFGMFIRPAAVVSVLEQPKREERKPTPKGGLNGASQRSRPPSGAPGSGLVPKRQSALGPNAARTQRTTSSPSPAPRPGAPGRALRSPTKSPTKQLSTSSRPPTTASRPSAAASRPRQSLSGRSSMALTPTPTAAKGSRQSVMGTAGKTSRPLSQPPRPTFTGPAKRTSLRPTATRTANAGKIGSATSEMSEETGDTETSNTPSESSKPTSAPRASLAAQRSVSGTNPVLKEVEDLKTKIRVMEKKRAEDREKLKSLETLRSERDKFEAIIQKLQTKYQPQQQEIIQLRKQLKDAMARVEEAEHLQAEHESIVEMAALDREMAEEMCEAIKTEFEALKEKAEELELEVEVLREENEELGQVMSPEEKSSQGWLQMERTNERLREALIRLRDMTQQQETDLRNQIKELEGELEDFAAIKANYEIAKEQLLITEANMEDLKQQVEALGAEEMIEELAEKNMQYQEQVNELKAVIEDLESLKEINDELEINHMETEKQLQEEIDFRESVYLEQARRMAQQDEVIEDLEYTLSKFRELVTNLQSDLEDMRVSQQLTETESTELTARSRAMMDLNMKLQASVSKAQTKTIEVELGRMAAEESAQHLEIMKLYLPEYFESERNPILALLRFKRVSFKATLMATTVRERISDHTSASAGQDVFTAYEVLEKLTWIASLCDRFINFINSCSIEEFSTFEGALYELEPVERILNFWIEGLKKNELNEKKCATELQRSIALLSHLAETLIPSNLESYADEIYMRSVMTQTYLDYAALSFSQLRSTLQAKLPPPSDDDEEGPFLYQKIDALGNQTRTGKLVAGKITRCLDDLKSRCLALTGDCAEPFEKCEEAAKELAELARQLGENIVLLTEEEGRTDPVTYTEITSNMSQTAMSLLQPSSAAAESDDNNALSIAANKLRTLGSYLEEASNCSSDLTQTVEFERHPAPWVLRAKELKSNKVISPDADEEIRRLKNEVHETSTALGVKDKAFEEQTIKIELLESRMRDAGKKAALAKDLESKFEALQAKEQELIGIVEKQSADLQNMERERDDYRARLEKAKRASGSTGVVLGADGVMSIDIAASSALMKENESLRVEVANLQAAVRFLREDNRRANFMDPYSVQRTNHLRAWLDTPLFRRKVATEDKRAEYNAASECQDVLTHLLKLTKESNFVDLKTTLPPDEASRLSWRPIKSTTRYQVLQQREEYEQWTQWKDEVVRRERLRARKEAKIKRRSSRYPDTIGIAAEISLTQVSGSRETTTTTSLNDAREQIPPTKGKGVMDRAWKILGIQGDDDSNDESEYGDPGKVKIVNH